MNDQRMWVTLGRAGLLAKIAYDDAESAPNLALRSLCLAVNQLAACAMATARKETPDARTPDMLSAPGVLPEEHRQRLSELFRAAMEDWGCD